MSFFIRLVITLSILLYCSRQIVAISDDKDEEFQCGVNQIETKLLVRNGFDTQSGEWPWHVAIYIHKEKNSRKYICGGTIINHFFVLTAAHCAVVDSIGLEYNPVSLAIEMGIHDLKLKQQGWQDHQVKKVIKHENYKAGNHGYDIALLQLRFIIEYTPFIQPACIFSDPTVDIENSKTPGTVVGWGATEDSQTSSVLQLAVLPILTFQQCVFSNRPVFGALLTEYTYCAGLKNGTTVCEGDSGGGMYHNISGRWNVIGIVSFTTKDYKKKYCSDIDYVAFTNVNKYNDWITKSTTKSISYQKCSSFVKESREDTAHLALIGTENQSLNKSFWFSSGTIISENFVLSTNLAKRGFKAINVTIKFKMNKVKVGMGMGGRGTTIDIAEIIFHEQDTTHRLALVKLKVAIIFSNLVGTACLGLESYTLEKNQETFSFDLLGNITESNQEFRARIVNVIEESECRRLTKDVITDDELQAAQICAANLNEDNNLLMFDPHQLYVKVGNMYHILYLTTLEKVSSGSKIGFFTQIRWYKTWIETNVWA